MLFHKKVYQSWIFIYQRLPCFQVNSVSRASMQNSPRNWRILNCKTHKNGEFVPKMVIFETNILEALNLTLKNQNKRPNSSGSLTSAPASCTASQTPPKASREQCISSLKTFRFLSTQMRPTVTTRKYFFRAYTQSI